MVYIFEAITWPENNSSLMTCFLGKAPWYYFPVFWECHAMEKWCEITALVSYSIWTLWYYKMISSNDFVKNFHNMESSIESWRFRTRSLCGLAPPTPCTTHLNVNHSRVPKEISMILQIKYIFTLGFQKQWRCQRQLFLVCR